MGLSIGQIPSGLLSQSASVFAPPARTERQQQSVPERPSVLTSLNRSDSQPSLFSRGTEDRGRFGFGQRIPTLSATGAAITTLALGVRSVRESIPSLEERQEELRTRLAEARVNPPSVEVRQDETLRRTEEDGEDQFPFDTGGDGLPTAIGEGTREVGTPPEAPDISQGLATGQGAPGVDAGAPNPTDVGFFQEGEARPTFANERAQNAFAPNRPPQATFQFQGPAFSFTRPDTADGASFTPQGQGPRLDLSV